MINHCTILLVRHPEARKNVEDRHGGEGTSLTKVGIEQCNKIARYILSNFNAHEHCVLVGHNVQQMRETADLLGSLLGVSPSWDERLKGLHLGVLANLSRAEAVYKWPDAANSLELWRRGLLQIDQLHIPNIEPLDVFRSRIENALKEWINMLNVNLLIAVCSRSTLIMLVNLIELNKNFNYQSYKVYDFDSGSITIINVIDFSPKVVIVNQISHLY